MTNSLESTNVRSLISAAAHRTLGTVCEMKSYMTRNGSVNLKAVEFVMRSIGRMEDAIFKKRRQEECQRRIRDERRKNQDRNKRLNRNQGHETRKLEIEKKR